jgi:antitoxin component of RelBE/YafQ-DinJ toxin-antitoxin module
MTNTNESLEIELDDNTAALAYAMAEEKGVTVEQLLMDLLSEAIETGYFDNPDNITTDDSLD